MSPSINFAEVKGLEPVPTGSYVATIVDAKEGVSQNQTPKIDVQWKIEDEGPYMGRIVFDTLTFTEKAMFRVKAALLGLGFPKNYRGEVNAESLIGKSARIVIDIETSTQTDADGEVYPPRNRVKKVKSLKK
jgi:hypothetical protein